MPVNQPPLFSIWELPSPFFFLPSKIGSAWQVFLNGFRNPHLHARHFHITAPPSFSAFSTFGAMGGFRRLLDAPVFFPFNPFFPSFSTLQRRYLSPLEPKQTFSVIPFLYRRFFFFSSPSQRERGGTPLIVWRWSPHCAPFPLLEQRLFL